MGEQKAKLNARFRNWGIKAIWHNMPSVHSDLQKSLHPRLHKNSRHKVPGHRIMIMRGGGAKNKINLVVFVFAACGEMTLNVKKIRINGTISIRS